LEKVSEHSTSVAAGTSLLMSVTLRPLAIMTTPDTEKENKQYAASNSICSGIIKFALVEAVALPIENAVKKIDKNPEKFLKNLTISRLGKNSEKFANSRSYKLLTQILKLSGGFLTAIPKSMLTIALIPIVMDKLFKNNKEINSNKAIKNNEQYIEKPNSKVFFTGGITDRVAKGLGKIIDNKKVQNFAIKYQENDKDIAKHITAATDTLLTATAVIQTNKSNKIKENRKQALNYNNIISTAITIVGGYFVDGLIKKPAGKFVEKFKKLNAGNPNLAKCVEGINILRPAIIFAAIYYGVLPIFSTYLSEKIDKYIAKH
jgi:hypothetical protein